MNSIDLGVIYVNDFALRETFEWPGRSSIRISRADSRCARVSSGLPQQAPNYTGPVRHIRPGTERIKLG